MLSFRRKEAPLLQLYGKLPIAKDYLRVGGGSDAGRYFRDWLDRGFGGGTSAAPELPGVLRFLRTERDGTALQGLLRPSSDAGGLRRFPLALWVERRAKAVAEERARAGSGDEGWWRALERCAQELDAHRHADELLGELRKREVVPIEEEAVGARALDLDAWALDLWPGGGWEGCERTLARLVTRPLAEPLYLPLTGTGDPAAQVSAWMRAIGELRRESRRESSRLAPDVFYPACAGATPAGARACLVVLPAGGGADALGPGEPDEVRGLRPAAEPAPPEVARALRALRGELGAH